MDDYIKALRSVFNTLQKWGIKIDTFTNVINQVEDGKQTFIDITNDFENKFEGIKKQVHVRMEDLITSLNTSQFRPYHTN